MKRRDFFKLTAAGAAAGSLWAGLSYTSAAELCEDIQEVSSKVKNRKQVFNMAGYAAPAYGNGLRIGYIGLGNRGLASLRRMARIEGVEIRAIADCYEYPIQCARDILKENGCAPAAEYFASKETWKDLCARDDLDFIYVATPPFCHAEMALHAMESGKHVATEVPVANNLTDCWKLVETSERTRKYCIMLENCLYDFFETFASNMALQGVFGEIVHGEGSYLHYGFHDIIKVPEPPKSLEAAPYYRAVKELGHGNCYPTHGFGPVCKAMRIGAGDRVDYLSSIESNDFRLRQTMNQLAEETGNPYYDQFKNREYCGNVSSTILRTVKGKSLIVQYGTRNPRPYSRGYLLSGEFGFAQKYPQECICMNDSATPVEPEQLEELKAKYTPELIQHIGEVAKKFGGHGGMDFTMDWRLVDCLRSGIPFDLDVYDAVAWSCLTPLTLWSVLNRSNSIDVPDFTGGNWETNAPLDLSLRGGGKTGVRTL